MADVLQTSDLIVIAQNYRGDVVRQANRKAVALSLVEWREGEGNSISLVAEGTGANAETFSEGADASNFGSDSQKAAILPFGRYRGNIRISGTARAAASTSRTPLGNVQLWARNIVNGAAEVASKMNVDFYTGAGGNALVGLADAIGDDANTYAGIDRSDANNAYWRPYVIDPGVATALTFDQIRKDLSAIYIKSGTKPDVALVHPDVLRAIASLFDPVKWYAHIVQSAELMTAGARGRAMFDGGIGAIAFDGCNFVEDKDCPTGLIHYLSTPHVRMEYQPIDDSDILGMADETENVVADDGFGPTPLGLTVEMLGKNGDSDRAMIKGYPQLGVERPNSCGTRYNVAVT